MKVYEKAAYINVKGEWEEVSMFSIGWAIGMEKPADEVRWFHAFGDLWNNSHLIRNASNTFIGFKKTPCVRLSAIYKELPYRITAKNMKNPIGYKVEYTEIPNPTFDFIKRNLLAPDFIKYVKYYEEKFAKPLDKSDEM